MTKIAWADESWNPVVGCSKVSEGCKNCYAERMAYRLVCMGKKKYENTIDVLEPPHFEWSGKVFCDEKSLEIPFHWRKPRRIFVCSMGDLFHPKVPFEFIKKVFQIIKNCPQHTFQILTKRPERRYRFKRWLEDTVWQRPNLWLGVTAENQKCADERIPILLQIPAAVRFVSVEPMLEGIKFPLPCKKSVFWSGIHQVIIGCESLPGGKAGRFQDGFIEAAIDLVGQCKAAGVAPFVKQVPINGRVVHDINKFPKRLQFREFPNEQRMCD